MNIELFLSLFIETGVIVLFLKAAGIAITAYLFAFITLGLTKQ